MAPSLKEGKSAGIVAPPSADIKTAKPKVSRLRRTGRAIARHPKLTQAAVLLLLISGTGSFLLYSLFKDAWSPQYDNLVILKTIFKMELNREDTRMVGEDPQQVITRSYQSLEPYVEDDGWVWVNRFGGTITYGKQEQRLIASCDAYSPLYLVCNLSEIP